MSTVEEKKKQRFRLLHKLYELTDGVALRHSIDIRAVGVEVGMSEDEALDTFDYLANEGLTEWMALGGFGTISHGGVREVEEAKQGYATKHFPPNITTITNSPGAQITIGENITATNVTNQPHEESVEKLEQELLGVQKPLPLEAVQLLQEAKKSKPDWLVIAQSARHLADHGPRWNEALNRFVKVSITFAGPGLALAEAIKLALLR